jgi:hypothetical protein
MYFFILIQILSSLGTFFNVFFILFTIAIAVPVCKFYFVLIAVKLSGEKNNVSHEKLFILIVFGNVRTQIWYEKRFVVSFRRFLHIHAS